MKWTKKDMNKLVRLWKKGLKIKEITENFPNRSKTSIAAKINEQQQRGNFEYRNRRKTIKLTLRGNRPKRLTNRPPTNMPKAVTDYTKKTYQQYGPGWKYTPAKDINSTAGKIGAVIEECEKLLLAKNKAYGDSALEPIRIFSKADGQEQLKVRIDDKLNRLLQGDTSIESDRDVIKDLVGYLILLLVSMDDQEK